MKSQETQMPAAFNSAATKDVKLKKVKDICSFLYRTKRPFILIRSGSTYEVKSKWWNEKGFRSGFNSRDLSFIKKVKEHVLKNDISLNFIDSDYKGQGIDYIQVKDYEVGEVLTDLKCIDINGAYWHTAYHLGIINDKIYQEGLNSDKVSKVVRLASLGSLAKTKEYWESDGVELVKKKVERSSITENLWFAICKRVSDVMSEAVRAVGSDFVFYWVDGIYIKNNAVAISKVNEVFAKHGYRCSIECVPEVFFHDKGFTVQTALKDVKKEYCWAKERKKNEITEYLENKKLLELANNIIYKRGK